MKQAAVWSVTLACMGMLSSLAVAREKTVPRYLRFTITMENPTTRVLSDQRVLIYAPVQDTGSQHLVDVQVDVPHKIITDAAGNSILELRFDQFPAFATRVVTFSTRLQMRTQERGVRLKDARPFLGDQRYIESELPAIRQLAAELKRAKPGDSSRAIYEWVGANLHYAGFVAADLGAAYALRERRGDCTEYAYLAAALARANGIPARVLGGYVTGSDTAPRSADYHNWAEFYVDGAWRLVDAQKGNYQSNASEYVAMRVITNDPQNPLGENHRFKVQGELVARME